MPNPITGSLMRVAGTWTDSTATLVDPTAITLKVKDPGGTVTSYSLSGATVFKDSTGKYHANVDTTGKPGHWVYEWTSTGTVQADQTGEFDIDPSPLQ